MKKLLFLAMAVLAICFIGCTHSDSKKVDPSIIGTTYLQYDSESNRCYAVIDSTEYPVPEVFIPQDNGYSSLKTSQIKYVDEVYVTLFTSPHLKGVNAFVGKQTEDQIRQMCKGYVEIETIARVTIVFILLMVGFMIYEDPMNDKIHHCKKT